MRKLTLHDVVRSWAARWWRAWELHTQDTGSAIVCVGWGSISDEIDGLFSRLAVVVDLDGAIVLCGLC